uniref:Uncharacterized protein n=1 Tax=viral metagenome TaxID=1070528 RepID=A0A6C0BTN1_9ZZZZ
MVTFLGFKLSELKCAVYSSLLAIFITYIISSILGSYATKKEKNPNDKPDKLSFKSQIIHTLVSFSKIPLANSIIIFIISVVAVLISNKLGIC